MNDFNLSTTYFLKFDELFVSERVNDLDLSSFFITMNSKQALFKTSANLSRSVPYDFMVQYLTLWIRGRKG